jgi:hypothetical protein
VDYAERYMFANPPQVLSIGIDEINPESGNFDFSVAVQFDQSMNTATNPNLSVTNSEFASLLTMESSYWVNDSLFISEYSVPEGNGSLLDISFEIDGFEPAQWIVAGSCSVDTLNFPLAYTPQPFDVDLKAPICQAAAPEPYITDANVGDEWLVELTFDEPMDTSSFDFSQVLNDSDFSANFSYQGVLWTDDVSAVIRYTILDNNNELLLPINAVFEGADPAGNTTLGCSLSALLPIDTQNPICYIGTPLPDFVVSDSEAETGLFSIDFYFYDNLDTTITPIITYPLNDPTLNTLTQQSIQWLTDSSFSITYFVEDVNEDLEDIVLSVSNIYDNNLNPMDQAAMFTNPFEIDTRNPLITSFDLSDALIESSPAGLTVTVGYDEDMDNFVNPTISFPEASQLALSNGTWTGNTFNQEVTLSEDGFNVLDIDVVVEGNATDLAGNLSHDSTLVDELNIQLVGIDENGIYSWTIYPNPAQAGSLVTINAASSLIEKVEIIDVLGKVIYASDNLQKSSYILAIPAWSSGCYYVRLSTTNGIATRPLIISEYR